MTRIPDSELRPLDELYKDAAKAPGSLLLDCSWVDLWYILPNGRDVFMERLQRKTKYLNECEKFSESERRFLYLGDKFCASKVEQAVTGIWKVVIYVPRGWSA